MVKTGKMVWAPGDIIFNETDKKRSGSHSADLVFITKASLNLKGSLKQKIFNTLFYLKIGQKSDPAEV